MANLLCKTEFTTVQNILMTFIVIFAALAVIFLIMFIVEWVKDKREREGRDDKIRSVYDDRVVAPKEEVKEEELIEEPEKENEVSVDEMLANLDELTKDDEVEVPAEEPVEEVVEEVPAEEPVEEVVEETPVEEPVEEEVIEEAPAEEPVEEEVVEEVPVEEPVEEVVEETAEPEEKVVVVGSLEDYQNRLEQVKASKEQVDKDYAKVQKDILKYERTERRKERNQKMLDRRAGELTNLNLVMYSVTDIKNVDEEKKAKQEDLTAHIAELKASIQDADEYLDSNRDKNAHNIQVAEFYKKEQARLEQEIAELEKFVATLSETDGTNEGTEE